jgi:RNA polymerase sigma factor (sigma-70 family)
MGTSRVVRGVGDVPPTISFDDFYRAHRLDAVKWTVALVGDRAVAEELCQDVFTSLAPRLSTLDNPVGYLRGALVNRAASWHRSHRRELRRIGKAFAGAPSSYTGETSEMLDALSSLPTRQRIVVTLRYWADWTDDEIATALDCASATVRVLRHRALVTLKKEIDR